MSEDAMSRGDSSDSSYMYTGTYDDKSHDGNGWQLNLLGVAGVSLRRWQWDALSRPVEVKPIAQHAVQMAGMDDESRPDDKSEFNDATRPKI